MTEDMVVRDWTGALENVKQGSDLSEVIGYCFSDQDLFVLCCLHEIGRHREKIEDLLEDCNFHYENGLLRDGKYAECKERVLRY